MNLKFSRDMFKKIKITINKNEENESKVYMESFKIVQEFKGSAATVKLLNVQFPTFSKLFNVLYHSQQLQETLCLLAPL